MVTEFKSPFDVDVDVAKTCGCNSVRMCLAFVVAFLVVACAAGCSPSNQGLHAVGSSKASSSSSGPPTISYEMLENDIENSDYEQFNDDLLYCKWESKEKTLRYCDLVDSALDKAISEHDYDDIISTWRKVDNEACKAAGKGAFRLDTALRAFEACRADTGLGEPVGTLEAGQGGFYDADHDRSGTRVGDGTGNTNSKIDYEYYCLGDLAVHGRDITSYDTEKNGRTGEYENVEKYSSSAEILWKGKKVSSDPDLANALTSESGIVSINGPYLIAEMNSFRSITNLNTGISDSYWTNKKDWFG